MHIHVLSASHVVSKEAHTQVLTEHFHSVRTKFWEVVIGYKIRKNSHEQSLLQHSIGEICESPINYIANHSNRRDDELSTFRDKHLQGLKFNSCLVKIVLAKKMCTLIGQCNKHINRT